MQAGQGISLLRYAFTCNTKESARQGYRKSEMGGAYLKMAGLDGAKRRENLVLNCNWANSGLKFST